MKTMITLLFSALCVATVSAQTDEKDNAMLNNGINFLDIPYVLYIRWKLLMAKEELIINCDEVDCTTFVEYTLAMALSPTEDGQVAEGDFATNLQRSATVMEKINGYPSRLHYIADWVNNGIRNGFLEDVTTAYSPYTQKSFSFFVFSSELYKQLSKSPENVAKMKEIEKSLNGQEFHYVPKDKLPFNGLPWIKNGDIIAITTNTRDWM